MVASISVISKNLYLPKCLGIQTSKNYINFLFCFISVFILLTRRKATRQPASNYTDLVSEMSRYFCPVKNFYFGFLVFIKIWQKFRIACQDCQAGKSVVKCISQGHKRIKRIARVGFNRDHVDHNHDALTTRSRCRHNFVGTLNIKTIRGNIVLVVAFCSETD